MTHSSCEVLQVPSGEDRESAEEVMRRLLSQAPTEVRSIVVGLLNLEAENMHLKQPHIKEPLLAIIKRAIPQ